MSIKTFCPIDEYFKPDLTCIKCNMTKKANKFQRENKIKDGVVGHVWRSKCTSCVKESLESFVSLPTKKKISLKNRVAILEDSLKKVKNDNYLPQDSLYIHLKDKIVKYSSDISLITLKIIETTDIINKITKDAIKSDNSYEYLDENKIYIYLNEISNLSKLNTQHIKDITSDIYFIGDKSYFKKI